MLTDAQLEGGYFAGFGVKVLEDWHSLHIRDADINDDEEDRTHSQAPVVMMLKLSLHRPGRRILAVYSVQVA